MNTGLITGIVTLILADVNMIMLGSFLRGSWFSDFAHDYRLPGQMSGSCHFERPEKLIPLLGKISRRGTPRNDSL